MRSNREVAYYSQLGSTLDTEHDIEKLQLNIKVAHDKRQNTFLSKLEYLLRLTIMRKMYGILGRIPPVSR
jgi:hypothetical protein